MGVSIFRNTREDVSHSPFTYLYLYSTFTYLFPVCDGKIKIVIPHEYTSICFGSRFVSDLSVVLISNVSLSQRFSSKIYTIGISSIVKRPKY